MLTLTQETTVHLPTPGEFTTFRLIKSFNGINIPSRNTADFFIGALFTDIRLGSLVEDITIQIGEIVDPKILASLLNSEHFLGTWEIDNIEILAAYRIEDYTLRRVGIVGISTAITGQILPHLIDATPASPSKATALRDFLLKCRDFVTPQMIGVETNRRSRDAFAKALPIIQMLNFDSFPSMLKVFEIPIPSDASGGKDEVLDSTTKNYGAS